MQQTKDPGQWPKVAGIWKQLGSPLRPVEEDLELFRSSITGWCNDQDKSPRGLILGVTPELYSLNWPDPTLVRAADRTLEMIEHVWPGPRADVMQVEWQEIGLPDSSFDVVVCDGGIHLLDFPDGQGQLYQNLSRLLSPGGLFIARLFVPPTTSESVEQVLAALMAGNIPNLNCLKLRLGMALQQSYEQGVALKTIWKTLRSNTTDWDTLARKLSWSLDHLLAIDAYRDSEASYYFIDADLVTQMLSQNGFTLCSKRSPQYFMGNHCPTLVFQKT